MRGYALYGYVFVFVMYLNHIIVHVFVLKWVVGSCAWRHKQSIYFSVTHLGAGEMMALQLALVIRSLYIHLNSFMSLEGKCTYML